jgi:hypothetical protein
MAQKADNFQRFYRAVVSPTHVRVTAGGRIVPNPRAPPQPRFSWNKERCFFEPLKEQSSWEGENINSSSWPQGVTHDIDPSAYQNAARSSSVSVSSGPARIEAIMQQVGPGSSATQEENLGSTSSNNLSTGLHTILAPPPPITISPPGQFDLSRPFMYNGQVVYPMPPGFIPPTGSLLPISMIGNPRAAMQAAEATEGFQPIPLPAPLGIFNRMPTQVPAFEAPAFQSYNANQQNVTHQPLGNISNTPSYFSDHQLSGMLPVEPVTSQMPMVTVQAMQSQLNGLRNHLKHLDNQLINNRHQIDEGHVISQHKFVKSQIDALEARLQPQTSSNHSQYLTVPTAFPHNPADTNDVKDIYLKPVDHPKVGSENPQSFQSSKTSPIDLLGSNKLGQSFHPLPDAGNKGATLRQLAGDILVKIELSTTPNISSWEKKSTIGSKLTAAAAKAPPFQPRSHSLLNVLQPLQSLQGQHDRIVDNEFDDLGLTNPNETDSDIEARLLSKSINWNVPGHMRESIVLQESSAQTQAQTSYATYSANQFVTQHVLMPTQQPFHTTGNQDMLPTTTIRPYLVGYQHPSTRGSKNWDYVYPRELTDEELRARHLYWGKAPRELQRGLPKFDGKDFFPPSPIKKSANMASVDQHPGHGANFYSPNPDLDSQSASIAFQDNSMAMISSSASEGSRMDDFRDERLTKVDSTEAEADDQGQDSIDDETESLDSWGLPNPTGADIFPLPPIDGMLAAHTSSASSIGTEKMLSNKTSTQDSMHKPSDNQRNNRHR